MSAAIKTRTLVLSLALGLALLACAVRTASAQVGPLWRIDALSNTTAPPGDNQESTAEHTYRFEADNLGDADAENTPADPIVVIGELPQGMKLVALEGREGGPPSGWACEGTEAGSHGFNCTYQDLSFPRTRFVSPARFRLAVSLDPAATGTQTAVFRVSGGGAGSDATADPLHISSQPFPFGLEGFEVEPIANRPRAPFAQAAGHPYAVTTHIDFTTAEDPNPLKGYAYPVEAVRDVVVNSPAGLVGNPSAFAQCTGAQLAVSPTPTSPTPECPAASQVGTVTVHSAVGGIVRLGPLPLFNMVPAAGEPARFGYQALGSVVTIDTRVRSESDYGIDFISPRISEGIAVAGADVEFWGVPTDPRHDPDRACPGHLAPFETGQFCPAGAEQPAFIRMPTTCSPQGAGLLFDIHTDSWVHPGNEVSFGRPDLSDPAWKSTAIETHKPLGHPWPESEWGAKQGTGGCDSVPVKGKLAAKPTALEANTSSGLEVHVEVPNAGLDSPEGIASSDIKKVVVALPEGITLNPSQAEGLGACSVAQYESSELSFHPDGIHGCPSDSKIGSVEVRTPLLDETIPGSVYIATPYANPFESLLALYVIFEEPQRGILIKLAGKVETDPVTGQITTSFGDLPQQPFSSFDFKFREGARAPLVTPQACGTYATHSQFTPWSDPSQTLDSDSSFQIVSGVGGGPCPSGGLPPFRPSLIAGTLNNRAGSYSPFNVRLFRSDEEQEITNFSIKLPPGVIGKLAGLGYCSDAEIAIAKSREARPNGGIEELQHPSCPASSQVGTTLAGAGVGSVLTYAQGKLYYAGSYHGSAISLVSITAAKVGPFDLGTVVVRFALRVNPETAEIFVDATGSDPIPHIINGITTHLRDVVAFNDRPEFVLNPTACLRTSTASTLLGSGLDFTSAADDLPVTVSTPFQAAGCAALPFKPKLTLSLTGATKRAGNPALRAVLSKRPGEANLKRAQVTLPRSEFLDNAHIGTVCTRIQFNQSTHPGDACPPRSVYGHAKVISPLVDYPLEGPLFLRSNPERELPDLVAAFHGPAFDINAVGHVDSVKGGGIRTTFEGVPDAPFSKVILTMAGAKKGLLENSTNLCAHPHRAKVALDGQNGKVRDFNPVVKPSCGKTRARR